MPQPFPNSTARRSANRLAKSRSPVARILRDISHLSTQRNPSVQRLRTQINDLIQIAERSGKRQLTARLRHVMRNLAGDVSDAKARMAVRMVVGVAGPAGRALSSVLATREKLAKIKKSLGAAERLVSALEGSITPNESGGRPVKERPQPAPLPPARQSGIPMPPNTFMEPNGQFLRVRTGNFNRRYRLNDPALTGEMINVKSSNVHSIGFKFNFKNPGKGSLFVRYLGTDAAGNRVGGGPLYEYFDVHPDKFHHFRHAGSQGIWVWDELRVRGSRVQHQVRYSLKGVINNYLPRRATVRNGREMFVQRTRTTRAKLGEKGRTLVSPLPNQDLGPVRGRPNRGRPNRGR